MRPAQAGGRAYSLLSARIEKPRNDLAVLREQILILIWRPPPAVGSCYIGQGWTAFAGPYGQEILRRWGIRTDYYAVMQLLLGYPREGDCCPKPKLRKDGRILRF